MTGFKTEWTPAEGKLHFENGTVHTEKGEKLYCHNCRFPFRKEHVKGTDGEGNPIPYADKDGHVYCRICAENEGIE